MSTVLASRNNHNHNHHQSSYMGEIPNYMNPNNPNPNRNPKPKSKKIKHFSNNHHVKKDSAGDAYSFNQRPVENNSNGFDCGGYVSYKVGSCSRSEINELRKKLVSDLERIRKLNDRIQSGEFSNPPNNSRSVNGKFKKLGTGNKRPLSSFREMGNNGDGGIGVMDEEMLKKCKQVLTKLMKHKMSWVFKAPVDVVGLGLHDYHQIIKRPMDLGTVKSNLSKGFYSNVGDFAADVRLVFENAMLYNPRTDDVHGMADQMLRIFEDLFRPIQAKLAKSNDRGNVNERAGNVHGMGNNARVFDMASERVVNVNDMVNDVVNEVNRVNEFSAVDELDGSSWDDVQTPERTKKAKSEAKSSGFPVASKQIHSTASNAVNAVIPPVVHSPVRMPSRTPSPMQVTEPVKPSNTSTMTKTVFPKLPKPRAKDPNKREMNMEEKQKLGLGLQSMPPEKMPQLLQIIRKRNDQLAQEGDEIELDIEALDTETLWELDRFVTNWKKFVSKTKRQALMVNSASAVAAPSVSADIDDVPMSDKMDGVKKSKKDAGEEDVDIGDEMPESSFPHVEIEKDDGGVGGQGQAVTGGGQGNNDNNASSSSSGSSSSSSSGSSSSSDSDSGSSSGSDSDADDAQS